MACNDTNRWFYSPADLQMWDAATLDEVLRGFAAEKLDRSRAREEQEVRLSKSRGFSKMMTSSNQ